MATLLARKAYFETPEAFTATAITEQTGASDFNEIVVFKLRWVLIY